MAQSRRPGAPATTHPAGRPSLLALEARINPGAGSQDLTYGVGGVAAPDFGDAESFGDAAVQADNKLVVAVVQNKSATSSRPSRAGRS